MRAQDAFSSTFNAYSAKVGQAVQANRQMEQSTGAMERSFNRLQQAFSIGIAGAFLNQVTNVAEQMNTLGVRVHANRVLFNELTDEIGGSTDVLANLREETGGVVDDLTLMSGASQLLRLNIVDNNRDLGELVGQIQRLKQPTESTTDAIQNFALMLSNESLLRLDSFGISSANVKRRMDELGETFREAVMAEMAAQVERLGEAANVSETSLARLQTRLENLWHKASANFSTGVEMTIALLEALDNKVSESINEQLRFNSLRLGGGVGDGQNIDGSSLAGISTWLASSVLAAQVPEEQVQRAEELVKLYEFSLLPEVAQYTEMLGLTEGGWRDTVKQINEASAAQEEMLNQFRGDFGTHLTPSQWFDPTGIEDQYRQFALSQSFGATVDGIQLFTPQEAAQAERIANSAQYMLDQLEELQPYIDAGLIPAEDVERMKEIANSAGDYADKVQKGAEAFERLNLAQVGVLTGASPDALGGELAAVFMEAARGAGLAADELERYQDVLDRSVGSESEFTQALEARVAALASSGASPEQIAEQVREAADYIRGISELGLAAQELIPTNVDAILGMTESGKFNATFDPQIALDAISEAYGLSTDMQSSFDEAEQSAFGISDALSTGAAEAQKMADLLATTLNGSYKMKIDVDAPAWLKDLVQGGGINLEEAMATTVRNNGGNVPGQNANRRSTRVVAVP